jgi:GT2 family glycosyltransferase
MLRGIAAQTRKPDEVVIIHMNEEVPDDLPDPECDFQQHQLVDRDILLPIAAARNRAAAEARGDILLFLDVDCIPYPKYVEKMVWAVGLTRGLIMGDIRYLPEGAARPGWTFESLAILGQEHPRRSSWTDGRELRTIDYRMFWSLTFGLRREDFARLGGFDEGYTGYAGEDTDLAFMARHIRLPIYTCRARVYHQYHPTYSPPYNHLEDIVQNARRFYAKWQIWPMEGWLKQFERDGFIIWMPDRIEIINQVKEETVAAALTTTPFG